MNPDALAQMSAPVLSKAVVTDSRQDLLSHRQSQVLCSGRARAGCLLPSLC